MVNFPGSEASRTGAVDDWVGKLLSLFVSGKFYTAFSFLFGLGFALQLVRAQARGRRIVPVYLRRMLALFLIGLVHCILIWNGDILMYYAFMGLFLIPFSKVPVKLLPLLAVVALAAGFLIGISEKTFLVRDVIPHRVNPELEQRGELDKALAYDGIRDDYRREAFAIKSGTYPEVVAARAKAWVSSNRYLLRYVILSSFCMFLLGMYVGRSGLITNPPQPRPLIRRVMWICLPLWLGLNLLTTLGPQLLGGLYFKIHWKVMSVLWTLQEPAGSVFYMSAILSFLAARPAWIGKLAPLGRVGRMGLTNYLLQSFVGTTLYYHYGFNLQMHLGKVPGLLLGITFFALQIPLSMWWLRRFQFGPFEWLWRTATYGHLPPFRAKPPNAQE